MRQVGIETHLREMRDPTQRSPDILRDRRAVRLDIGGVFRQFVCAHHRFDQRHGRAVTLHPRSNVQCGGGMSEGLLAPEQRQRLGARRTLPEPNVCNPAAA